MRVRVLSCSVLLHFTEDAKPVACGERAFVADVTYGRPICALHISDLAERDLTAIQTEDLLVGLGVGTRCCAVDLGYRKGGDR